MIRIGPTLSSVRKRFIDTFSARSDTIGGLGTATDGSSWTATSGTITVGSGKATATAPTTNAAGSQYPIATVSMPTGDNIISIVDTGNGASAAVWVQSSSDWWMVSLDSTFNTIPGNTNYTSGTTTYTSSAATFTSGATGYTMGAALYSIGATQYTVAATTYTAGTTSYTMGANTFTSATPYNASTPYTANSPFSSSTPYTAPTGYVIGYAAQPSYTRTTYNQAAYAFATKNTYKTNGYSGSYQVWTSGAPYSTYTVPQLNNAYTAGTTSYTAGATTYTAGGTSYTVGTTSYTVSADVYTSNIPYTSTVPYSSAVPYTSNNPYTSNTPYTSTNSPYTSNTPYTTGANAVTYAYQAIVKINKSVGNTVSSVTSAIVSTTQTIKSLLVQTTGNQITAKAFSDTNLVSQLGSSLVYTATGATVNTTYGISISPTQYAQSAIIGSGITITRA